MDQEIKQRGTTTTFSHSGLKNADAQTSVSQAVNATQQYDAFGNLASSTGTWQGQFGYGGGFGYQQDATGLKLLGHRYYDSSTGRFLTRDPIKDGRNWYVYCDSDPLGGYDDSGLQQLLVPPAPKGVNVRNNVKEVKRLYEVGHTFILAWIFADMEIYNNVRNGGKWDYKQRGKEYEAFGNFHYGIVMAAYKVDEELALRGAGWAQQRSGTSRKEFGHPLGGPPFGDDPKDQYWIKMGFRYYREVIAKPK